MARHTPIWSPKWILISLDVVMCIVSHIGIQCGHWVCSVFVCGGCSYTNMPTERRPLLLLGQRNAQQLPLKSTSHNYQFFSISVFIFALHAFSRFYFFLLRLHSPFSKLVFIVVGVVVAWLVAFLFVKSFCARCIYIVHFGFIDRD